MKTVQEIEKELALAKKLELKLKWEIYLDQVKSFMDKLVGKTIINHYSNGGFNLYKVIGYKEQYYIDRDGWDGQWSPCRWIEIQTSSYITCKVADNKGRWYNHSGVSHPDISSFKAITYKGKSFPKDMQMSKIEFNEMQVSEDVCSTIANSIKVGFTEYKEYTEDPNYDRALQGFTLFSQLAPKGMWERAKEIADEHFMKTKLFWEEFEPKCQGLKPLRDEVPFK